MAVVQAHGLALDEPGKMYSLLQDASKGALQGKRPLAPAPERGVLYANGAAATAGGKRKIHFVAYGGATPQAASVARRNARERNRVKQVNNGFAALRQHIPQSVLTAFGAPESAGNGRGGSKKLSKVETLRVAVEYIKSLQRMLEEHEAEVASRSLLGAVAGDRFFAGSPDPPQQYQYQIALPTPPSSEASASPTPSQTSDVSSSPYQPTTLYVQDSYRGFETKGADDEELLDAIFSWQQSE